MKQTHHAITSNEKLFPVFAQKLASKDRKDYVGTMNKLKVWLGSEKAYYEVARPKIVEMLEIAYATFANEFVRIKPSLADHLRQLVQTVRPFLHLFVEGQLQARVQHVIHETDYLVSTLPAIPSSSSAEALSAPQHPMPMSFTVPLSRIATMSAHPIPPPLPATSWTPATPPNTMVAAVKTELTHVPESEPSDIVVSSMQESKPLPETAPAGPSNALLPPPTSASAKPQPKRIRKPELSEELTARDLDWFRSKHQSVSSGDEAAPPLPSPSQVEQSSTLIVSDGMPITGPSPSRKRKTTARMVPSRYPRKIPPPEATQEPDVPVPGPIDLDPAGSAGQRGSPEPTHAPDVQQPSDSPVISAPGNIVVDEQTAGQQGSPRDSVAPDVLPAPALPPASADDVVAGQIVQQESPTDVHNVVPVYTRQPADSFTPVSVGHVAVAEKTRQAPSSTTDDVVRDIQPQASSAIIPSTADGLEAAERTSEQQESPRATPDQAVSFEGQQAADCAPISPPTQNVDASPQATAHRQFSESARDDEQTSGETVATTIEEQLPRSGRKFSPPVTPTDVTMEAGETEWSADTDLYAEPPQEAPAPSTEPLQFEAPPTKMEPSPMEVVPPEIPETVAQSDSRTSPLASEAAEEAPLLQRLDKPHSSPFSPPTSHQERDNANGLPTDGHMFPSPQIKAELATPQVVPTSQDVQARKGRFGGMMVVIHGLQGKPYTCTHDIEFNLDDTFFSCISTWVNRKASPDEVSQSVCISLACYRLPDLFATIQSESQLQGIAELTSHSSCSWPTSGRLSLQIERHSKHYVIPLCPPVILTPDNCVDVSSFMSSGHNTFRLTQQGDLSEFAFVFHAHHPSDAQLAELNAVAVASKRWKELVGWLGSPIGSQSPWVTFTSSSIPPS